jgi:hypothetical protein
VFDVLDPHVGVGSYEEVGQLQFRFRVDAAEFFNSMN